MDLKIIAILILLSMFGGTYYAGYDAGKDSCTAENAGKKDEADKKDEVKVETVIKWRTKTKVEYRDKIKKIYLAKDATGCADTKLIDMGFGVQ